MKHSTKETEPQKKGFWIPIEIWNLKNISTMERLILAELSNFDQSEGCYSSNAYLAKLMHLSTDRVSKIISKLNKLNYIHLKLIYVDGTKQVYRRFIRINYKTIYKSDN